MSRNAEFHRSRTYQADLESVTAAAAADYHNRNQGSSFYVHGGDRARSGYSIGGLEGAPESHYPEKITPGQYQEHRDRVRKQVKDPSAIAGSWVENGGSVMDASSTTEDRDEAKRLQIHRNQRAVYNLGKGKDEDLR